MPHISLVFARCGIPRLFASDFFAMQRPFSPSLVSGITSYSVDISIEATVYPSLKGTGPGPYMTRGHLELAYGTTAAWCSPGLQSGGAGYQTRLNASAEFEGFRVCVRTWSSEGHGLNRAVPSLWDSPPTPYPTRHCRRQAQGRLYETCSLPLQPRGS